MITIQAKTGQVSSTVCQCAVVPVFEKSKLSGAAAEFDKLSNGAITTLCKSGDFSGLNGQTHWLPAVGKAARVLVLGLGKSKELSKKSLASAAAKMTNTLKASAAKDAAIFIPAADLNEADIARTTTEALFDKLYQFEELKSTKRGAAKITKAVFIVADKKQLAAVKTAVKVGQAIASGIALTKDLGNRPGNVCTPTHLTENAKAIAKSNAKTTAKALNAQQCEKLGMGSYLSVAAGSDEPSQFIIMEYKGGAKTAKPIVLVGKGITFDTGGISLKPGGGMDEMKFDMGGSAAVLGAMKSLVELELAINVVALIPATENMPNGRATKPGDVVTSMSGLTIEVLNTDAEGRLVLCDALTYAERYKPKAVIDVATLTGACVVALGKHATGLYANKDALAEKLLSAGEQASDKAWRMPLWDEYQSQLDSNFADMANIGGMPGGSITAACFLSRFAKKYDWAHLDIAGTAWHSGAAKGSTGRPVSLLVQYLINEAK